jgi:hypothetical protein
MVLIVHGDFDKAIDVAWENMLSNRLNEEFKLK